MNSGTKINGLDRDDVCKIVEAAHFSGYRDKGRLLDWVETVYFILDRPEVGKALAESMGLLWIATEAGT